MIKEQNPNVKISRKKRQLKYIAILPSLITLMNGLCGFVAIIFADRDPGSVWSPNLFPNLLPRLQVSFLALAGYMIFLGMIADVLDGHVARISKSTSSFGAQLDSLCDAISFGVAPAFLMFKLVERHFLLFQLEPVLPFHLYERIVFLIAIIYAMCAIIRLARFNVENKEESSHLSFDGLPSPAAAGLVVSMVIFQQNFLPELSKASNDFFSFLNLEWATIWLLPILTLIAGLLMVTRIPYPHVVSRLFRGKKSFSTFLLVLFAILLIILNIQLAMFLGFCIFALYGLIRWIVTRIIPKKEKEALTVDK